LAVRPSDQAIFVWNNSATPDLPTATNTKSTQGLLRVDGKSGATTYVGGSGQAGALAFAEDGKLYVFDTRLKRFDTQTGTIENIGPGFRDSEGRVLSVAGAATHPTTGVTYVAAYAPSIPFSKEDAARRTFSLFVVDLVSGTLSRPVMIKIAPGMMMGDLSFGPNGKLYGTAFGPLAPSIFVIDADTGSTNEHAKLVSLDGIQGFAFQR
jgi:hypothetical protein